MIFETMKKYMKAALKEFASELGAKHRKPKCGKRHWLLVEVGVVPLPKDITGMKQYKVVTPVPPGKGYALKLSTDEAVDKQDDGNFATGTVISGDSTAPNIMPTSTNKLIDVVLRGDGGSGVKVVNVKVDGHVDGPGGTDLPLNLEIEYLVDHKDATDFSNVAEVGVVDLPPAV